MRGGVRPLQRIVLPGPVAHAGRAARFLPPAGRNQGQRLPPARAGRASRRCSRSRTCGTSKAARSAMPTPAATGTRTCPTRRSRRAGPCSTRWKSRSDDAGEPLGPTLFASAAAAYDALDEESRARIADLQAVHRFAAKERGVKKPVAVTRAQIEENPDARHPVARPHPKTGPQGALRPQGRVHRHRRHGGRRGAGADRPALGPDR